ncbi:glycosyltransferase [filamentous cyanobacterium LEGE 11480]|uniref:Glycosyltransferase n=1 Tax=Romeriopsis navalis LEGE 11480 TaxID=2777977 RepID=A0A928VQG2_9CYAN|nr:glycosyltransferase [Romeriopsis navalis]MBE9030715.1 glycosyltransferase [Romeriopsis navalis LEGE 11480]
MNGLIKLIEIELSQPLPEVTALEGYGQLKALVKFRQRPLGWVELPISGGGCQRATIAQRVLPYYTRLFEQELVQDYLLQSGEKTWALADLLATAPEPIAPNHPLTVAYCLCDRHDVDYTQQLQAIAKLDYPNLEVFVVEALPSDAQVQQLVEQQFPEFRYFSTPEWGLNAARNLAIDQAQGEFIAFLDHQASPAPEWASMIVKTLSQQPHVAAVTGLVIPQAINDRQQSYIASHHALERGFEPRYYHWHDMPHWSDLGTSQIGSGANLACRRTLFEQIGQFDPALDIPGKTAGGGDFELFIRALMQDQTLLYEPSIIAYWHLPTTEAGILKQCQQRLQGFYSATQSSRHRYPHLGRQFLYLNIWRGVLVLMRLVRTYGIPRSWSWTELKATLTSSGNYAAGLTQVAALAPNPQASQLRPITKHMAVRTIDLAAPIPDITDITDYRSLRVFIQQNGHMRGKVDLHHQGEPVNRQRLARAIAEQKLWQLLAQPFAGNEARAQAEVERELQQFWLPPISQPTTTATPTTIPIPHHISIIIPTCDRPDDLISCLTHLRQQQSDRHIEIIVADNRPQSGISANIVAQFPGVRYIAEPRAGSSYARNTAITASTGEIIVMVDDDVVVPPDWLEKLLAPLARPDVAVVMGNLLPFELETPAQWVFEDLKGGLTQGWKPIEANRAWLDSYEHSPPTWNLGVSANAAFRASLFAADAVGLMEEVLGAGTPCRGGEENHLVYKVLRAGHTLIYDPQAYAWHRHRKTMQALCKQWHGYMRSATCYHLILWRQEQDMRAKRQLFSVLPQGIWGYVCDRIKGKHHVPWMIVGNEISGYFAGFWGYYQSVQRVKRLGRSAPYIPVQQRSTQIEPTPTVAALPPR